GTPEQSLRAEAPAGEEKEVELAERDVNPAERIEEPAIPYSIDTLDCTPYGFQSPECARVAQQQIAIGIIRFESFSPAGRQVILHLHLGGAEIQIPLLESGVHLVYRPGGDIPCGTSRRRFDRDVGLFVLAGKGNQRQCAITLDWWVGFNQGA